MNESVSPQEIPDYSRMTGEIYDLIYSDKDYEGQAHKVAKIISERCRSGGNELLEAACGTGTYMSHLAPTFNVEGFDLSHEQVTAAQKRLPQAKIIQADMVDFDMGKQYDAVVCLFSSIGYLKTKDNLDRAVANFARHTKPGGVIIVEPWLKEEDLIPGHVSLESASNDHLAVSRMGKLSKEGNITTLDMHHMLSTDSGIEHFVEQHQLALYTDEEFIDAFSKAALENVEIDQEGLIGRRLFIATKPM